jgi:dTDP-4-amino-4,6-dideoxygalactose transaminase/nucleoside-diphosphate-sugar epimerase
MGGVGRSFVLIGGSSLVGTATARELRQGGSDVVVVDVREPVPDGGRVLPAVPWHHADLLVDDLTDLPPGDLVVMLTARRPLRRAEAARSPLAAMAAARLLSALGTRHVTLVSSAEVYGSAADPAAEDADPCLPISAAELDAWCDRAVGLARQPCPPWHGAALVRELRQLDTSRRWTFAMAARAVEIIAARSVPADRLTVLRLGDVVAAPGDAGDDEVSRLIGRAIAGLRMPVPTDAVRSLTPADTVAAIVCEGIEPGTYNVAARPESLRSLAERIAAAAGVDPDAIVEAPESETAPLLATDRIEAAGHHVASLRSIVDGLVSARTVTGPRSRPIEVVVPPRLEQADVVVERQQTALWTGAVKHGNRWTTALEEMLAETLEIDDGQSVVATASGTAALRLAVAATVGAAQPGDVAVLPSFTYVATAEVLAQLGYALRYADVDPSTWTLDAGRLSAALDDRVRVVVAVDTFGQPCDYAGLRQACDEAGVALVADSAAGLGSRYRGRPLAGLADAHSYSMSFAKVLSSGGAGGAVCLPADRLAQLYADPAGWTRSELMTELHAVVALDQLCVLEDLIAAREQVAAVYSATLADLPGTRGQVVRPGDRHSYVHWVLRTDRRSAVQAELDRLGVGTKPYFPALHRTTHPSSASPQPALPVTDALHQDALALPMSSELSAADADLVVVALAAALASPVSAGTYPGDEQLLS